MMTASMTASVALVACANLDCLVSMGRAKRHTVEVYANGDREITVIRRPGKITVKLAKHGTEAEFTTRNGDTLRTVGAIVDTMLNTDSITEARKYMKKVCRNTKRAPASN